MVGQARHGEILGSGVSGSHQPRRLGGAREHPVDCAGQLARVSRRHQQRVPARSCHIAVAGEVAGHHRGARGHRLQQHDAEGLSPQGRSAEHVGPLEPGDLLAVGDGAEPLDACIARRPGPQRGRVRTGARNPQPHRRRERCERVEQHAETLAGLVAANEKDRRTGGAHRLGDPVGSQLHAVVEQVVASAQNFASRVAGGGRDRHPQVEAVGEEAGGPGEDLVREEATGRVEGADERSGPYEQRCHGRPGRQGLVEVDDVEGLVPHGSDGPQLAGGVGSNGGYRAVGDRRQAVAERRHVGIRRRAVARAEHPRGVPAATQRPRQPEHLHLHTAGLGEAVGADDAYPHSRRLDAPQRLRDGQTERLVVAGPVGRHQMPLLGRGPDQLL